MRRRPIAGFGVVLLCAGLLLAGCRARTATLKDLAPLVGKDLLYLGKSGTDHVIVDVAGGGRRFAVRGDVGAVLAAVPSFSEISLSKGADGEPFLSGCTALAMRVPILTAGTADEAAKAYPGALLDSLMYRRGSEYAVEGFTVKSVRTLSSKPGKTVVEFVADVKPVRDPFDPGAGARWGEPGPDGYVRDRRYVITLYDHNGQYGLYCPNGELFAEGALPASSAGRKTLYQPASYGDWWQALEAGKEVENVLCEDAAYSYITALRLRRSRSGEHFEATVYRIERETGKRIALFDLPRNTTAASPFALRGRTLYLETIVSAPRSEGRPGQITALDLSTGEYTVLLGEPAKVLGKVEDTVYIVGLASETRPGGIYALDLARGVVRRVSALPGPSYDPSYSASALLHFSGGRLYLLWPEESEGACAPNYSIYTVDPAAGTIEKQR